MTNKGHLGDKCLSVLSFVSKVIL